MVENINDYDLIEIITGLTVATTDALGDSTISMTIEFLYRDPWESIYKNNDKQTSALVVSCWCR